MFHFGSQIIISDFIFIMSTWMVVETKEFISLISSPKGDFCITNSSSAMYYTTTSNGLEKRGHSFLPPIGFSCDFDNSADQCNIPFIVGYWKLVHVHTYVPIPFLDIRWELLEIKKLPFKTVTTPEKLAFTNLVQLNDAKTFKIILSLKGKEAHFMLCDKERVEEANCYWFALQGWSQDYTGMRRCKRGDIRRLYPDGDCVARKEEVAHPKDLPLYMDSESWSHIIIERIDKNLYLKMYKDDKEQDIIHYTEPNEMFHINYLLGHRKDEAVYLKLHETNYMYTTISSEQIFNQRFSLSNNSFCLSLLVNTCHSCAMELTFFDKSQNVAHSTFIPTTNGGWETHKVTATEVNNGPLIMKISTMLMKGYERTGSEFWSFDYIRECHIEEYRTTETDTSKISRCQLLTGQKAIEDNVEEYVPGSACSIAPSIGRACIPCSTLQNQISCEKLKICESVDGSNECYCSPGYTGNACNKECGKGTYGNSCRYKCGFCSGKEKCNVTDGSCNDCDPLFEGRKCQWPKNGQYLARAAEVIVADKNSCKIQWNKSFFGKGSPQYYWIQYADSKDLTLDWKDYGKIERIPDIREAVVGNLGSGKKYQIRILISDQLDTIKTLEAAKLPFTICNTSCSDLNDDQVIIEAKQKSVTIKLADSESSCNSEQYKYELKNENDARIRSGEMTSSNLTLTGLNPFTDYTFLLYSNSHTMKKKFTTQEGVPSPVRNIYLEKSTTNSINLHWEQPEYVNGVIKNYQILYQKIQRVNCYPITPGVLYEEDTVENRKKLDDLEPYSVYEVEIIATNGLHSSKGLKEKVQTLGLDDFDANENLDKIEVTYDSFVRAISIQFKNVVCSDLLGPLNFSIEYRCISEWCSNKSDNSIMIDSNQNILPVKNLQPFCDYQGVIYFCRIQGNCKLWRNGTFNTLSSVPSELKDLTVTAVGDTFISLRWLIPYPPTGLASGYEITTKCTNCNWYYSPQTRTIVPERCSIWPAYYCYKIMDSLYYNYIFSVEIGAINEGNSKYTKVGNIPKILVLETTPEKPYNLSVFCNLDNTIELFWYHPNKTNGPLNGFLVKIDVIQFSVKLGVEKESLIYTHKIDKPIPPAMEFYVRIAAINNKYVGFFSEIKQTSYPLPPDLSSLQAMIENYTESTITITFNITQEEYNNQEVRQYILILIDDHASDTKDQNLEKEEKLMNTTFDGSSQLRMVARVYIKKKSTFNFTIGSGNQVENDEFSRIYSGNEPLQKARYYNITIVLVNDYKGKNRHVYFSINGLTGGDPDMTTPPPMPRGTEEGESSGGSIFYILMILLILLPVIIIGIIIKRKNIKLLRSTLSLEKILEFSTRVAYASGNEESVQMDTPETVVITHKPVMKVKPKLPIKKSTNPPNASNNIHSKPVKIADFEEYVKISLETGELENQHALFPRGQTQPWQHGSTKMNKPKNRYNNLIAYDHSRVILEKIPGDENSDYINANYIHGYNIERAYIATQGPKSSTLLDFWRMIWQENVRHIVMVANIYEAGKKKVDQYWPNINEELTFQDISVQYESMQLFANYEYRILQVSKGEEIRKIEQLHFTTWPDHGIPLYPQSLVPFLRKLLKIPLSSTNPIVVHCSAGVGRTGTILLADMTLRMASKEGVVDLLNNLQKLREQRPNMVDNIEQYKLAHLVVLESIMGLQTSITCNEDMDEAVQRLIRNEDYKVQINYLKETEWKDDAMKTVEGINQEFPNYPEKNRFQEITPENQGRIFISRYPHDDESSTYINAVPVDGFRCPGRFLVTQQPLPNTVGDFWRFVTERQVNVIISLNEVDSKEKTCCQFWPTADQPEIQPVDFLLIKFGHVTELEYYNIYSVNIWINNRKEQTKLNVQIISFKCWPARATIPSCCEEFLSFYEEADAISRGSKNVIVTCFDGATASGVYVALCFIIEQMKLEHECDVCLAARTIRHNRKQFVKDESQFLFLYDCAVKYINGFQPYANFQNQ